jgi:hypothetical protein
MTGTESFLQRQQPEIAATLCAARRRDQSARQANDGRGFGASRKGGRPPSVRALRSSATSCSADTDAGTQPHRTPATLGRNLRHGSQGAVNQGWGLVAKPVGFANSISLQIQRSARPTPIDALCGRRPSTRRCLATLTRSWAWLAATFVARPPRRIGFVHTTRSTPLRGKGLPGGRGAGPAHGESGPEASPGGLP